MQNSQWNSETQTEVKKSWNFLISAFGYGWVMFLVIVLDQFTKILAENLLQWSDAILLFSDILIFKYIVNTGIAFGFPLRGVFLLLLTALLIIALCWYVLKHFEWLKRLERFGYILIISGALGNGYDRFFRGFVIDFISLKYFAIFNVADIVITVGAMLIILAQYKIFSHAKH